MEKFTIANNTAFRYTDSGSGERTILLIHGYLESVEVWDSLLSKLTKESRVITFDIPGHGLSEVKGEIHTMNYVAETAAALLDKLSIEKVTVVGHSMGGYVALALAKLRPSLIDKLVLLHSSPDADTPEKSSYREREIEIIRTGRKELLATINPEKGFAKENHLKCVGHIKELEQQVMITDDDGIVALLNGMASREDNNATLGELGERAMMVFGKKDAYMPLEYCESLAQKHPKATILWLENSGHNGHVEEQARFVECFNKFLNNERFN